MKVLVIGNGAREDAIAYKVSLVDKVKTIFLAPGNARVKSNPKLQNVPILVTQIDKMLDFALEQKIDLTIVGSETPLVLGIVDKFEEKNLTIIGPNKKAAKLEGSKEFSKKLLIQNNIPTAKYKSFSDLKNAKDYIKDKNAPFVIKADGLAAGKGVIIAQNKDEADKALESILNEKCFGESGNTVIIEDFLEGEEVSYIVLSDGKNYIPLATSQDYKKIKEQDKGANTGGMGANSPAALVDDLLDEKIKTKIITPVFEALKKQNIKYKGFLYAGLIIDKNGDPYVIEFNCRLGDPEAQVILMRLKSDIIDMFFNVKKQSLSSYKIKFSEKKAIAVVLCAKGYPFKFNSGQKIDASNITQTQDLKIFSAGTCHSENHELIACGGRVLTVVALEDNFLKAKAKVYENINKINMQEAYFRKDIGNKLI